jgi:hypothetical protein
MGVTEVGCCVTDVTYLVTFYIIVGRGDGNTVVTKSLS